MAHKSRNVNEVPRLPAHDAFDVDNRLKKVGGYIIGKSIGEGSFAKVKEGIHIATNMRVAVKVVNKTELKDTDYMMRNLHREADVLRNIRHENVVQLYEVMETENHYYLVLELVRGGDLMTHICNNKTLSEQEAQKYTRQIISAVDYLHNLGIVHRDLKVENLLLDDRQNIKIIDFGLSNNLGKNGLLGTQCGSPAYAAPEVFSKNPYGPAVDIWSIGINLYAMLTGQLPFHVEPINIVALHEKIMKGAKIPTHFSEDCQDVLSELLIADEDKRIDMDALMKHPWVNDNYPRLEPACDSNINQDLDIDIVALEAAVDLGFSKEDILNSLSGRKPTKHAATYYLLVEKMSGKSRKSSLTKLKDLRRGSVDIVNLAKVAERGRNMLSPPHKRKMKKSPKLKEKVEQKSEDKASENSNIIEENKEQLSKEIPSYNVKGRRQSVGESIQNFFKEKLRSNGGNNGDKKNDENKKNGNGKALPEFMKSPLDITKMRRNRRHSVATVVAPNKLLISSEKEEKEIDSIGSPKAKAGNRVYPSMNEPIIGVTRTENRSPAIPSGGP